MTRRKTIIQKNYFSPFESDKKKITMFAKKFSLASMSF